MYGTPLAGVYGYSHMLGGYDGLQAEFVRVPIADFNLLPLPADLPPKIAITLSDISITAWHGLELGEVTEGRSVAIWGAGPVGLLTAALARIRGASQVIIVDPDDFRLSLAAKHTKATTINSRSVDVFKEMRKLIPKGPDVCIDCVGVRSIPSTAHAIQQFVGLETDNPSVASECLKTVRLGGNVALIGDYFMYSNRFPVGCLMEKSITVRGGQLFPQKYWKHLLELMQAGKYDPSFAFTHELPFAQIENVYEMFDNHTDNMVKVLLFTGPGQKQPESH